MERVGGRLDIVVFRGDTHVTMWWMPYGVASIGEVAGIMMGLWHFRLKRVLLGRAFSPQHPCGNLTPGDAWG
jgi:hypothetical protein